MVVHSIKNLNKYIIVHWDDNKRRKVYEHGLRKICFERVRFEGRMIQSNV